MTRAMCCLILWALAGIPAVAGTDVEAAADQPTPTEPARQRQAKPGAVLARMETSLGDIVLELNAEKAPISVANFLRYAEDGFYDGTVFHRVVPYFLIQGGGYTTASLNRKTDGLYEPIKNEWNNGLKNVRLTIAAARVPGKPDSATSQFYINVVDNPRLDQAQEDGAGYAVFGRVIEGAGVVEKIRSAELRIHMLYKDPSGEPVTPKKVITILSVHHINAAGEVIEPPSDKPAEPEAPDEAGEAEVETPKEDAEQEVDTQPSEEPAEPEAPDERGEAEVETSEEDAEQEVDTQPSVEPAEPAAPDEDGEAEAETSEEDAEQEVDTQPSEEPVESDAPDEGGEAEAETSEEDTEQETDKQPSEEPAEPAAPDEDGEQQVRPPQDGAEDE